MPVIVPWRKSRQYKGIDHKVGMSFMKDGHWLDGIWEQTWRRRRKEAIKIWGKMCSRQREWQVQSKDLIEWDGSHCCVLSWLSLYRDRYPGSAGESRMYGEKNRSKEINQEASRIIQDRHASGQSVLTVRGFSSTLTLGKCNCSGIASCLGNPSSCITQTLLLPLHVLIFLFPMKLSYTFEPFF